MPTITDTAYLKRTYNLKTQGDISTGTPNVYQVDYYFLTDDSELVGNGYDNTGTAGLQSMEFQETFAETDADQKAMFELAMGVTSGGPYSVFITDVVSNVSFNDNSVSASTADINIGVVEVDWNRDNVLDPEEEGTLGYIWEMYNGTLDFPDDYPENYAYTTDIGAGSTFGTEAHGDIWLNSVSAYGWSDTQVNLYPQRTVVHELLHSLGLMHPDGSDIDNWKYSTMSEQPLGGMELGPSSDPDDFVLPTGLQMYDIAAIQEIFGTRNYGTRDEATVYEAGAGFGGYDAFTLDKNEPFIYTIWDGAGEDVIDASAYDDAVTIDLRQGNFSSIGKALDSSFPGGRGTGLVNDNVGIAFYTVIENAIGTDENDDLIGNAWNNKLYGGEGNDWISGDGLVWDADAGFHANDTLDTRPGANAAADDSGNDILIGGEGDDYMLGGHGDDLIHGGYNTGEIDAQRSGWNSLGQFPSSGSNIAHSLDGMDTVDYGALSTAIRVVFNPGTAIAQVDKGIASDDTLVSIEEIIGTSQNDFYSGGNGSFEETDHLTYFGGNGADRYYFDLNAGTEHGLVETRDPGVSIDDVWVLNGSIQMQSIYFRYTLDAGIADFEFFNISDALVTVRLDPDEVEYLRLGFSGSPSTTGPKVSFLVDDVLSFLTENVTYGGSGQDLSTVLYALIGTPSNHSKGLGDGATTITETGGVDTLTFGAGVTSSIGANLSYAKSGDDLVIAYGGGADVVTVADFFQEGAQDQTEIEGVHFADSTVRNLDYIYLHALHQAGTSGSDTLTGLSSDYRQYINSLDGGDGNDTLVGANGADTLVGGLGADVLDGGTGTDALTGGDGNDIYVIDDSGDAVTENVSEGTDTVQASIAWTLGSNLENLTLTGSSAINGTGNSANNSLTGNTGNNTLDGGAGNDAMAGGTGDDTYIVDSVSDTITENASEGTDTVQSSVSLTLGSNVDNLTLAGSSNINGTGNTAGNIITANSGNNTLSGDSGADTLYGLDGTDTLQGGSGSDTLDGGTGADGMIGGTNNDTYIVDNASDVVTENASEGSDTVMASITYTLVANTDDLVLTGSSNINGTGNGFANVITGNSGNNTLSGANGEDTIDGGGGTDTLIGGLHDDVYIVDTTSDTITENASEGTDEIRSSVTYTIASLANIENLTLTGSSNINATGNSSVNVLTGNSGNNTLNGSTGADTMIGGAGDDVYVLDNASDVITEGASAGTDTVQASVSHTLAANVEHLTLTGAINGTGNSLDNSITGNSSVNTLSGGDGNDHLQAFEGHDTLIGGNGNDTLDGHAGNDAMSGGAGDDVYVVGSASDVVTENASEGTDTVQSYITWTIGSNVENITLINNPSPPITAHATGNSLNNTLDGSLHDGVNTLSGSTGNDTYIVDSTDIVSESASEGTDTVRAAASYSLTSNVENLVLTGSSSINGTGNTLANVITGNSGANTLSGGDGADTLAGAGGLDTLTGGTGDDIFVVDMATAFSNIDVVTDFNVSTQEDVLDFRDVLEEYDPLTETLTDFLQIADSGGNSTVSVDRDGTGGVYSMAQIATLSSITGLTDEAALVASGNLLVA